MIYADEMKRRNGALGVEQRQSKLAKNSQDMERWLAKLLRAAHEVERLRAQRKRLLRGPSQGKVKYRGEVLTGMGGRGNDLDDSLEGV